MQDIKSFTVLMLYSYIAHNNNSIQPCIYIYVLKIVFSLYYYVIQFRNVKFRDGNKNNLDLKRSYAHFHHLK